MTETERRKGAGQVQARECKYSLGKQQIGLYWTTRVKTASEKEAFKREEN